MNKMRSYLEHHNKVDSSLKKGACASCMSVLLLRGHEHSGMLLIRQCPDVAAVIIKKS